MRVAFSPARIFLLSLALGASGCTIAPLPEGGAPAAAPGLAPPPGYGTLRQEDVSLMLASGDLRLMVTPLHPSITRVTAPDTERRLAGMLGAHAPGSDGTGLFLVSFYSDQPDVPFVPEEVQFISRGLRVRPQRIVPVTPSWGEQRVGQRQTEMAVYDYGAGIDLESSLVLAYEFDQSTQWNAMLPRIQAERARALARAGVAPRD